MRTETKQICFKSKEEAIEFKTQILICNSNLKVRIRKPLKNEAIDHYLNHWLVVFQLPFSQLVSIHKMLTPLNAIPSTVWKYGYK